VWQGRKQALGQIGRIVYANPAEGERYFLRVLLNHVRGATSFKDMRTVVGVTYFTFREACEKRGIIETDRSIDDCLTEATTFQMPSALRRLFATILVLCEATNIRGLWDKHKDALGEDLAETTPTRQEWSKWCSEIYEICFTRWVKISENMVCHLFAIWVQAPLT
jgi:hypothetical protein